MGNIQYFWLYQK